MMYSASLAGCDKLHLYLRWEKALISLNLKELCVGSMLASRLSPVLPTAKQSMDSLYMKIELISY